MTQKGDMFKGRQKKPQSTNRHSKAVKVRKGKTFKEPSKKTKDMELNTVVKMLPARKQTKFSFAEWFHDAQLCPKIVSYQIEQNQLAFRSAHKLDEIGKCRRLGDRISLVGLGLDFDGAQEELNGVENCKETVNDFDYVSSSNISLNMDCETVNKNQPLLSAEEEIHHWLRFVMEEILDVQEKCPQTYMVFN
eukprot:Gb_17454 [translate_table: standard]